MGFPGMGRRRQGGRQGGRLGGLAKGKIVHHGLMGYDRIPPTYPPACGFLLLFLSCHPMLFITPFLPSCFFLLAHLARISSWCVVARKEEGQGLVTNWQQNGARDGKQAKIGEGKRRDKRRHTRQRTTKKREGQAGLETGCVELSVVGGVSSRRVCVVVCLPFSRPSPFTAPGLVAGERSLDVRL